MSPLARKQSRAFQQVLAEGIHDKHLALLRAHFAAPEHTTTWARLAQAVGYPNGNSVNLQYGRFAERIARQLGLREKPFDPSEFQRLSTPFPVAAAELCLVRSMRALAMATLFGLGCSAFAGLFESYSATCKMDEKHYEFKVSQADILRTPVLDSWRRFSAVVGA